MTTLRYRSDIAENGKEKSVPAMLVFVNTRPDKPLRLDEHYLRDRSHRGKIPHPGDHVSAEAVELDSVLVPKHATISIENGEEYRRRVWVPAAVMVKTPLRDQLSDMLLTVAVNRGRDGGWQTSTNDIYNEALPIVPGNPKTKMKQTGFAIRFLCKWKMIKKLNHVRGTLPSRHFAEVQVWELTEPYRQKCLQEVIAARLEFSRLEAEKVRKDEEKASGQVTLDQPDPMNLEM
jgi:hypothetical protein